LVDHVSCDLTQSPGDVSSAGEVATSTCNHGADGQTRSDTARVDSRSFIRHLKSRHHLDRILLVSGDREAEVRYLAERLGIVEVYAGRSPEEKSRSRTLVMFVQPRRSAMTWN
jgi:cation transport ATPase